MKSLLFNIYKVCYLYIYKDRPEAKSDLLGRLTSCVGVFLFLAFTALNIYLPFHLILGLEPWKINKPMMWLSMLLGTGAVYFLMFNVFGLKDLNYNHDKYRPNQATIRRTILIFAINAAILVVLTIIKLIVRKG